MPMYEYICLKCDSMTEGIRTIASRDDPMECRCGGDMSRVVSAPSMHVWATERSFPNLRKDGDGTMSFGSKTEYEAYLKQNHIAEFSHDAPVKRPHGNRVVGTWR